jgi:hypothetical protein
MFPKNVIPVPNCVFNCSPKKIAYDVE